MLQSKKLKGIEKDEFGEDIDAKIEELKEFFKMLVEAYVALFESSQSGEPTKEGNDLIRQMNGYANMKGDACLSQMMTDSDGFGRLVQIKYDGMNKSGVSFETKKVQRKPARVFAKERPEKRQEKPASKKANGLEDGAEKPQEQKPAKVGLKPVLKKSDAVKANGNLVHVKAPATQSKPQPAKQRAMGKNQMQMTAPQMGRF